MRIPSDLRVLLFLGSIVPAAWSADALLLDGAGPWRDAGWQRASSQFQQLLQEAGYVVRVVPPPDLPKALESSPQALVAAPSLEILPLGAMRAIAAHVRRGGSLLATGGEPFRQPLYPQAGGAWKAAQELLLHAPRTVIVDPAKNQLTWASVPAADACTNSVAASPDGVRNSLEVRIAKPLRLDPLQSPPFPATPFAPGQTVTVLTVRGTPGEQLRIEWREEDGQRWWARVPLSREWRTFALQPADFTITASDARTPSDRRFDPRRARAIFVGLAYEPNLPAAAPVEFAIAPISTAAAHDVEAFETPALETISPWYKQYQSMRNGHPVRIPIARPRGLTCAREPDGRFQPFGDLLNPAATRYLTAAGAALFWMPEPEISGSVRAAFIGALRTSSHRVFLLDGGAAEFVHLRGEPVGTGAFAVNQSGRKVDTSIEWSVRQEHRVLAVRRVAVSLEANDARDVPGPAITGLAPGEYEVATTIRVGTTITDSVNGYLRIFDPRAPRPALARLQVAHGHFTAAGRQVFLNGVNYWPRNVSGLEIGRYWDHWLTPRNYDPQIVEADLAALENYGFNLVSIQYSAVEQARPLIDVLERCRKHHIWVHLSMGSAGNLLKLNPERDTELLQSAYLPGNEAVFGYELAWEPHLGRHDQRSRFDEAWRSWIVEQYGSLDAAEAAWGAPSPRNAQGQATSPLDSQIQADGPHRVMVAAYRRFADDLVSRAYGRAVRHIRTLDPGALFAVRTGYGGSGLPGNNLSMGYDLVSGAAHLDAVSGEAYGLARIYPDARIEGFLTAYSRFAGNGKPVMWLEYGASVGPRGGNPESLRNQAWIANTMMDIAADSGVDGTLVWWFPGGWRVNEQTDYGIFAPDGTARPAAMVLRDRSGKFQQEFPQPGSGEPVVISIDRDADARGMLALWQRLGNDYITARKHGRPVRLETAGTGKDTAGMPLVQVGNVPYRGAGPLKYVNAEITGVHVTWPGGEKRVENGAELDLPRGIDYSIAVQLLNTGEATWLPAASPAGDCRLHTGAGDARIDTNVERFAAATASPIRVHLGNDALELKGRLTGDGSGPFGESLRLVLKPR